MRHTREILAGATAAVTLLTAVNGDTTPHFASAISKPLTAPQTADAKYDRALSDIDLAILRLYNEAPLRERSIDGNDNNLAAITIPLLGGNVLRLAAMGESSFNKIATNEPSGGGVVADIQNLRDGHPTFDLSFAYIPSDEGSPPANPQTGNWTVACVSYWPGQGEPEFRTQQEFQKIVSVAEVTPWGFFHQDKNEWPSAMTAGQFITVMASAAWSITGVASEVQTDNAHAQGPPDICANQP